MCQRRLQAALQPVRIAGEMLVDRGVVGARMRPETRRQKLEIVAPAPPVLQRHDLAER